MKCNFCGAELESSDQNFCQFCGAKIPEKAKTQEQPLQEPSPQPTKTPTTSSQGSTYQPPTIPTGPSQTGGSSPSTTSHPLTQPSYGKKSTAQAHSYAKKCLASAIISIALSIFAFIFGGMLSFIGFIETVANNNNTTMAIFAVSGGQIVRPFLLLIPVGANIIGLILGIASRKYKSRSEAIGYADDNVRKVGSVFAVFGIILNAIGLAIGGMALFNNFMALYSELAYN